jgi:hypothetical protein
MPAVRLRRIVSYHQMAAGQGGASWSASVEEVFCFGWIDDQFSAVSGV